MDNILLANPSALIDVFSIVFILVFAIVGAKNGFVKTFFKTFGTFISLLLSVLLCSLVANFLESKFGFVSTVSDWLKGVLTKIFGEDLMNTTIEQINNDKLENGGVAAWIVKIVLSLKSDVAIPENISLNQIISPVIAYYVVCTIALVGLFIIIKIIFVLLGDFAKALHSIKVVGFTDGLLGFAFGFLQGIILLDVLIIILNALPFSFAQRISYEVDNTVLTSFLTKINLLGLFFDLIVKNGVDKLLSGLFV